jgi:acyl dehydratase/NAD(P)-dependent dehydrogenase (short-subunit alcohol dehydrogenase family)
MSNIIASRVYLPADQARFAKLSGDFNPIHIDPIGARRIGVGAPVVHGVHNLLWCLESFGHEVRGTVAVASLRVNFDAFVRVNEQVDVLIAHSDAKLIRIEARVRGTLVITAQIGFSASWEAAPFAKPNNLVNPVSPIDPPNEMLPTLSGTIPFATPQDAVAAAFPCAARMLGSRRITALLAFTRLVGMVCPGLHSVFTGLSLQTCNDDGADDIGFKVADVNLEHRRVRCAVVGGGWTGLVNSMIRHRPVPQAAVSEVARHVVPDEFARNAAMVVGGSRGIGEVAAKIIAVGGGRPIITYATGESDAQRVANEIRAWGGICDILKLDIRAPIAPQVASIESGPKFLLYFASPMIGGRRAQIFDPDRMREFLRFYVTGFYDCCAALIAKGIAPLTALYPSTVFLEDRPIGVTEYVMAKAAGEQLCRDMNLRLMSFRAVAARLPRLATDQNPEVPNSIQSVCEVLIPVIRNLRDPLLADSSRR